MDDNMFQGFDLPSVSDFLDKPYDIVDSVLSALNSIYCVFPIINNETESKEFREALIKIVVNDTQEFVPELTTWLFDKANEKNLKPFSVFVGLLYNLHIIIKAVDHLCKTERELAEKLGFSEKDYRELFESFLRQQGDRKD